MQEPLTTPTALEWIGAVDSMVGVLIGVALTAFIQWLNYLRQRSRDRDDRNWGLRREKRERIQEAKSTAARVKGELETYVVTNDLAAYQTYPIYLKLSEIQPLIIGEELAQAFGQFRAGLVESIVEAGKMKDSFDPGSTAYLIDLMQRGATTFLRQLDVELEKLDEI